MSIQELISMLEARLNYLRGSYTLSTSSGNIEESLRIDAEIKETERTLDKLKYL